MQNIQKKINLSQKDIAIVTDLHIGSHKNSPLWHEQAIKFSKWFRDDLHSRKIKDIVICGDVNNDRNEISVNTLFTLSTFFDNLREFNIVVLVGNHDAYYKDRSDVNSLAMFNGWPNITIVDRQESITAFSKRLTFCSWGVKAADIQPCDILFGHFEINGFNMSKAKVCTDSDMTSNILEKAPLVISGHFHMREERKYKNGTIIYVGSPYELNWGDCGSEARGYYTLNVESGNYTFIENTISPKHKKIRLSEITALGKFTPELKAQFPNNIINIIIDQDISSDRANSFVSSLSSLGSFQIKADYSVDDKFELSSENMEFESVNISDTIRDFVAMMANVEHKDKLLKYTLQLYKECSGE